MATNYSPKVVKSGVSMVLDTLSSKCVSGSDLLNVVNSDSYFTLYNSPTVDSDGVLFDGINDFSRSDSSTFLKWQNWSKLSFTLVFKYVSSTGAHNGNRAYILDLRSTGGINGAMGLFIDSASTAPELTLFYNKTGTSYEEPTVYNFNTGEWLVYSFSFDKTSTTENVKHWINGERVFTRSLDVSSTTVNAGTEIWLGRYAGGGYYFNGIINYLAFNTDYAFTDTDAYSIFNCLRSRVGL